MASHFIFSATSTWQLNARAEQIISTLQELHIEVLRHLAYSPDLAPTKYKPPQIEINIYKENNIVCMKQLKMCTKMFCIPVCYCFVSKASKVAVFIDRMGTYFD